METIHTTFNQYTPEAVRTVLDWARINNKRIRIYYGNRETGRDWCEVHDTIGYIGRSCGKMKIPLLIHNSRSTGGTAILDDCIVQITHEHRVLYRHPNYHMPLKVDGNNIVNEDGECFYHNDDHSKVLREYKWFTGESDRH